eukprot:g4066.t1
MAVDAHTFRDRFLPELSKSLGSTPSEASPRRQWALPRRDTPQEPLSDQTPAAQEIRGAGTKILELAHGELAVSEEDGHELGTRDVEAYEKVQPSRGDSFLKHRRATATREVSPCLGKGRGLGMRAVCPGDAGSSESKDGGADVAAGGEMRDDPPVAEASGASSFRGGTRGSPPDATVGESRRWNSVLNENIALRRQVSEMEDFLEDHGLIWVGTGPHPGREKVREGPTSFDLDIILCNIQELNGEITREGRRRVVQTPGGAKFQEARSLHLAFYADGIVVNNGDLRPYSDHATKSFVSDLRDGFFPSEFKASDPDGLLVHAVDRRSEDGAARPEMGQNQRSNHAFSGKGQRLGGHKHRKRRHSEHLEAKRDTVTMAPHSLSSSLEAAMLRGDYCHPEAPSDGPREEGLPPLGRHVCPSGNGQQAEECRAKRAVVKVRIAPTALNMEFRMGFEDTVEDLWRLIAHRMREKLTTEENQPKGLLGTHFRGIVGDSGRPVDEEDRLMNAFELRLPYSGDANIDMGLTIEEAGLTPKAVVIFQLRRNAQGQVHTDRGTKGLV